MGNAAGKGADGLHLLGLLQLAPDGHFLLFPGFAPGDIPDHGNVKGNILDVDTDHGQLHGDGPRPAHPPDLPILEHPQDLVGATERDRRARRVEADAVQAVGGDVVTGVGSMTLLFTALRERVPTVILFRMLLNILADVLIGAIPLLGDVFDFFWRSNRRNLALIERYRDGDEDPSAADYVIAVFGMLLALAAMAIPFLWIWGTYTAFGNLFGG